MSRLKLILPKIEHKENLMDYKKEFIENGDSMDGSAGLSDAENFEDWYNCKPRQFKRRNCKKRWVSSSKYIPCFIMMIN